MSLPAGITGIFYSLAFASADRLRVELYVDPLRQALRPLAWPALLEVRAKLEERYGEVLEFEELPNSRASRIASYYPGPAAIDRQGEWPRYRDWLVQRAGRFREAVQPELDRIRRR